MVIYNENYLKPHLRDMFQSGVTLLLRHKFLSNIEVILIYSNNVIYQANLKIL